PRTPCMTPPTSTWNAADHEPCSRPSGPVTAATRPPVITQARASARNGRASRARSGTSARSPGREVIPAILPRGGGSRRSVDGARRRAAGRRSVVARHPALAAGAAVLGGLDLDLLAAGVQQRLVRGGHLAAALGDVVEDQRAAEPIRAGVGLGPVHQAAVED